MDGYEKKEGTERSEREEIFSKAVRAGKRTYFFDVKATRKNDYYLTITESKKRFNRDGRFFFEKHKVFLYKEDFEKFADGLEAAVNFIKEAKKDEMPEDPEVTSELELEGATVEDFTSVEFEDLEDKQ